MSNSLRKFNQFFEPKLTLDDIILDFISNIQGSDLPFQDDMISDDQYLDMWQQTKEMYLNAGVVIPNI